MRDGRSNVLSCRARAIHYAIRRIPLVMVVPILLCCSCENECDTFYIEGTVHHTQLCWLIQSTDGKSYEPINLPREFAEEGLAVVACVKKRTDLGSFCMIGQIVEIVNIRRAE
jgi:hypothetical protein